MIFLILQYAVDSGQRWEVVAGVKIDQKEDPRQEQQRTAKLFALQFSVSRCHSYNFDRFLQVSRAERAFKCWWHCRDVELNVVQVITSEKVGLDLRRFKS